MGDPPALDMASGAEHLEPANLTHGLRGPAYRPLDRILDTVGRAADDHRPTGRSCVLGPAQPVGEIDEHQIMQEATGTTVAEGTV